MLGENSDMVGVRISALNKLCVHIYACEENVEKVNVIYYFKS